MAATARDHGTVAAFVSAKCESSIIIENQLLGTSTNPCAGHPCAGRTPRENDKGQGEDIHGENPTGRGRPSAVAGNHRASQSRRPRRRQCQGRGNGSLSGGGGTLQSGHIGYRPA